MKKSTKIRRKRSVTPSSLRLGILITVLTLIVAAAAVLMVPALNVTEVYCEGNNNITAEEVISSSQIELGKNILLVNIGKARRQTEKFAIVEKAEIRRVFPNKICISITEREPAAYLTRGMDCIAVASDGVVLKKINGELAMSIIKESTPVMEEEQEDEESGEENIDETDDGDSVDAERAEETEEKENAEEDIVTELKKPYLIPLVAGIEASETEEGDKLKEDKEGKLDKVIEICNALSKAQLLQRTTYIDVTNMTDVRLVVENRLDIYIGAIDNIDYRISFLAEVIEKNISSYEKVVMDYRGDDVYVRAHEDGKDRILHSETEEEEEETDTEDVDAEESEEDEIDTQEDNIEL